MLNGLQHALTCSQLAGNAFVEATCMALIVSPLADRGDPADAAVLRGSVDRLREIRYDMALTFLVARLAVWFVHVGRPDVATLLDEQFRTRLGDSYPAHYEATIRQLDQLLDRNQFTAERSRGRNMNANELTDYLHDEFATLDLGAAGSSR